MLQSVLFKAKVTFFMLWNLNKTIQENIHVPLAEDLQKNNNTFLFLDMRLSLKQVASKKEGRLGHLAYHFPFPATNLEQEGIGSNPVNIY